jgi:hypothetical protein
MNATHARARAGHAASRVSIMQASPSPERLATLVSAWESLAHLPLDERVLTWARIMRAKGEGGVFARTATYLAAASGSATAATYTLTLAHAEGHFVLVSLAHPSPGTADIIASALRLGAKNRIDSDVLCDAWCEAETDEDRRGLPHPLILDVGGTFSMDVTGTALNTTGLTVRGYHVDALTAEVIRASGELVLEGINHAPAIAPSMDSLTDRLFRCAKRLTHIVSKETLAGDAVRHNVSFSLKADKLHPKDGKVIPPLSTRKAGARVDVDVKPGDSLQLATRYTSVTGAGANTGKLQVTIIGRRHY